MSNYNTKPKTKVAVDAEWDGDLIEVHGLKSDGICFQAHIPVTNQSIICFNSDLLGILPSDIVTRIELHCAKRNILLYWKPFSDTNDNLSEILNELNEPTEDEDGFLITPCDFSNINVVVFAGAKDLWMAHGWSNLEPAYDSGDISKKRALSGTYKLDKRTYSIWDLQGWTNDGLKALGESVGAESTDKGKMDWCKGNMLEGLLKEPEVFVDYSIGDVVMLPQIITNFTKGQGQLQIETLNIPAHSAYTEETIPKTIGACVARTIETYIDWNIYPSDPYLFQFCLRKHGILDPNDKGFAKSNTAHNEATSLIHTREDWEAYKSHPSVIGMLAANYEYLAYSFASVKYLGSDTRTTGAFGALVHGGRAHNEQPHIYSHGYTFDADERSAYGIQLCTNSLPIGIPHKIAYTPNEKRQKVGYFIDKILPQCEPGSWEVVFSGYMGTDGRGRGLSQDLVTSKRVDQKTINRSIICNINDDDYDGNTGESDELRKIPGDFGVIKCEIVNGILNQRVLEVYSATANNEEMKALRDMEIVTVVYYTKADKCESVDEWIDAVLADTGAYTTDSNGHPTDTRTSKWFPFALGSIFQKTVDSRNHYKPLAKKLAGELKKLTPDSPEYQSKLAEWKDAKGRQEALKLFNNTGYGCLVSPYFKISNVIVGNNITGGIRCDTWMLKVPVAGDMTITDGTPYNPTQVLFLTSGGKKPGLTTISDLETLKKHRSITVGNLGGIDWAKEFKTAWTNRKCTDLMKAKATDPVLLAEGASYIDQLTTEHVNTFWANYGLKLTSTIEHKPENTAIAAATWSKADYCFKLIEPLKNPKTGEMSDYLFKIRGAKDYKTGSELRKSPKFQLLKNIVDGSDEFPTDMEYDHFSLCSPGKYRQVTNSKGYLDLKNTRPGDSMIQARVSRFNNDWMSLDTFDTYDTRKNRATKKNAVTFEKFAAEGIKKVHARMLSDNLR